MTHEARLRHKRSSFDDLKTSYLRASSLEIPGVLHALAHFVIYDWSGASSLEAIKYLCRIGNKEGSDGEDFPLELDADVRREARKVIVRIIIRDLASKYIFEQNVPAVHELLKFFSQASVHCPRGENDRKTLGQFLKLCWELNWERKESYARELIGTTMHAGCEDLLSNSPRVRMMLYQYLVESVSSEWRDKLIVTDPTLRQVTLLCGLILSFNQGSHLDDEKRLATRLLQLQALNVAGS